MERNLRATFLRLAALPDDFPESEVSVLESAFETLIGARRRSKDPLGCSSAELLVLAGEAAVQASRHGLASTAAEAFFLQGAPEDQFFVRALFIKALVVADAAKGLNGWRAVEQRKVAIAYILKGLTIALQPNKSARYNFLVFNASVHLWSVVRPMLRDSARKHVVEPLQKIVDGLEVVDDKDWAWRTRLLVALAIAHGELGNAESAVRYINEAAEFARRDHGAEAAQTQAEVRRLQMHLGRTAPAAVLQAAAEAKERGDLELTLQCIRSGIIVDNLEEELLEVFRIADPSETVVDDGDIDEQDANAVDSDAKVEVGEPVTVDLGMIVEIGRLALANSLPHISERCIEAAGHAKKATPRADVTFDYFRAELLAETLGAHTSVSKAKGGCAEIPSSNQRETELMDKRRVEAFRLARRVEAVKVLERAITSCKLLGDAPLLEEGCILAWNIALPLLQPHLRKHAHRVFQTAAAALEDVDSRLVSLRAHLHTEVAKCEVTADFLAKASTHVAKAIALDYGSSDIPESPVEQQEMGSGEDESQRPLDKFLCPLQAKLELKGSLYKEPESVEEQALMQIEQAKDARDPHLKGSLLSRAASLLEKGSEGDTGEGINTTMMVGVKDSEVGLNGIANAASDDVLEERCRVEISALAQQRLALWGEIVKLSWEQRILSLTQRAARQVHAYSVDPESYRELAVLQAEVHFVHAETFIEELRTANVDPEAPLSGGLNVRALGMNLPSVSFLQDFGEDEVPDDCWDANRPPFDAELLISRKRRVIKSFLEGLRIGQRLHEDWIVENAVVYLWNYRKFILFF